MIAGLVTAAVPATLDQVPVPVVAAVAARVVAERLQKAWSGRASAVVGFADTLMFIVSVEAGQLALLTDHTRVEAPAIVKLETAEEGEAGAVTAAEPAITDHAPVPTRGEFAASAVAVTLHNALSGPALASEGALSTVIIKVSVFDTQVPLATVHWSVAEDPVTSPVIAEMGLFWAVMEAVPAITDQVPVPVSTGVAVIAVLFTLHKTCQSPHLPHPAAQTR